MPARRTDITNEEVKRLYDDGQSMQEICQHFGVSAPVVRRRLIESGVHVRTRWETSPPERIEVACLHCGKLFLVNPSVIDRGHGRYCSRSCVSSAVHKGLPKPKSRLNLEKAHEAHKGMTPWNKKPTVTLVCVICQSAFEVPERRAQEAKYCSRACAGVAKSKVTGKAHPLYRTGANQLVPMTCQRCGKTVMRLGKLKPQFRFCSKNCTGAYASSLWRKTGRISSIELALRAALDKRGVAFDAHYRIGRYKVDIAIPSAMLVIEADGDYWHGERPQQLAEDQKRDSVMTGKGWTVLRFTESQIRADVGACADEITRHLQSAGQ